MAEGVRHGHSRMGRRLVLILIVVVALAGLLLMVRRAVRATNRDAWAHGVIDIVSLAALMFTQESGKGPESLDDLIDGGYLLVEERDGLISIRSAPPLEGGTPRIDSLDAIRLHFPESIEGWRIVEGSLVDQDGKQTRLPYVEIVGVDYLPGGIAEHRNRQFAVTWFETMHGGRPYE